MNVQPLVIPNEIHAPFHHGVQGRLLRGKVVEAVQLRLEDVPAIGLQNPSVFLFDVVAHLLQEVGEQVLLIGEVLVEAPPGDARPADDLVDGDVGEAGPGVLLSSGVEKATPLFLRQPEEGLCTHMYPSPQT